MEDKSQFPAEITAKNIKNPYITSEERVKSAEDKQQAIRNRYIAEFAGELCKII